MAENLDQNFVNQTKQQILRLLEGDFSRFPEADEEETGDPEIRQLLDQLRDKLSEVDTYAQELAKGNLSAAVPPRSNYLAGGMKTLHAHLNHLVWQASQVAQGRFDQVLDYMGEISQAFNEMTDQLKLRQKIFSQHQESMMRVFNNLDVLVMVCAEENGQILFINHIADELFFRKNGPEGRRETALYYAVLGSLSDYYSLNDIYDQQTDKWYRVESNHIDWNSGERAILITCMDITVMKQKAEELTRAAKVDGLTGIMNRAAGLRLLKEIILQKQEETLLTLCYIDMDNLKYINDTFGHRVGDESIITFSNILSSLLRANDLFIRMGGDEFLVVLMGQPLKLGERIINRIVTRFEEWNQTSGKPYRLEFTYGLYEVKGPHVDLEAMLDMADQRMYLAKRRKKGEG